MEVGETVMFAFVFPVFHKYVPPPVAVSNALSPRQIAEGLTLVAILGFTVTMAAAVAEHPDELVTVTEYIPDAAVVTLAMEGFCEEEVKPLGPVQK